MVIIDEKAFAEKCKELTEYVCCEESREISESKGWDFESQSAGALAAISMALIFLKESVVDPKEAIKKILDEED